MELSYYRRRRSGYSPVSPRLEVTADVEPVRLVQLRAKSLGAERAVSLDRDWVEDEGMLIESLDRRRASDNELHASPTRRLSSLNKPTSRRLSAMKQPTLLFPEAVEVVTEDGKETKIIMSSVHL